MTSARARKALIGGLFTVLLASVVPARAAGREFRIGILEFRQFTEQTTCPQADEITEALAEVQLNNTGVPTVTTPAGGVSVDGTSLPLAGRLPQFSLEKFKHGDCVLVKFVADGGGATTARGEAPQLDPPATFELRFFAENGSLIQTVPAEHVHNSVPASVATKGGTADTYGTFLRIGSSWPAGETRIEIRPASSGDTGVGKYKMTVNALGTRLLLDKQLYKPGDTVTVGGVTWEDYQIGRIVRVLTTYPEDPTGMANVPGQGTVTLTRADGRKVTKEFTAGSDGFFKVDFTAADYGNVAAGGDSGFVRALKLSAFATYTDSQTGEWKTSAGDVDSEATLQFASPPDRAQLRAKFTSETGWVEPGGEFVHQIEYRNMSARDAAGVVVSYTLDESAVFVKAAPIPSSRSGRTLTWSIGSLKKGSDWSPARRILVTARAKTESEDRTIKWQNLSSTATMTQAGEAALESTTHGPKVTMLDTARYGDRPFPVVLIEYSDAKHSAARPGWYFNEMINQRLKPSSVANLYREMTFDQLFPQGTIPSVVAEDTSFDAADAYIWSTPFTGTTGRGACVGRSDVSIGTTQQTSFKPGGERIVGGWYQLPGEQAYYGGDRLSYGQYAVRLAGNSGLGIDNACGPVGKAAFDAASIADPDIDYNDYDTDRNGVVDFFMYISRGLGGNGASQTSGYDAIWPHSSDIQGTYVNANGERGYVSKDQLRDRLERPLWWPNADARKNNETSRLTTRNTGDALKAYVRVGPYNANPEVSTTSVIAHEYGHSLGLPDFYSTSNRETVDYWDLMATDNAQFMSVFSRQDLGWIVPKVLARGSVQTTLRESKIDTHTIEWFDSKGRPYLLSGPDIHNADAYYIPLPETSPLQTAASGKHLWWSTRGDDFGCPGKTLDVPLHQMKSAASGDTISLTFKNWYEIEWDYDYGFVLVSADGGKTWTSLESANGSTTPAEFDPNGVACQEDNGNGITGTSVQRNFPTNAAERAGGVYGTATWVDDKYDLSVFAGKDVILRFAYSTDPGLAKMGWAIDDLKVTNETKNQAYLDDNVESRRLDYIAGGWTWLLAGGGVGTDRGYYLELRDRIGFDLDGRGQADRTPINWLPGVSLWWTDEFGGYGNVGQETNTAPNQSPIDARAEPNQPVPRLEDASFFDIPGINRYVDTGYTDNYIDGDKSWRHSAGCFSMTVEDVTGLGKPGATARLALAANAPKCRAFGATAVLGSRRTQTRKPSGGTLPATGVESGWLGVAALAVAAGIGFRAGRRRLA